MKEVRKKTLRAYLIYPVLAEVYFHICKVSGKTAAEVRVATFLSTYPVKLVPLNKSLVFKAGELKCQYPGVLSYVDCLVIALALNHKLTIHTTEKSLGDLIPRLYLQTYQF